jgi:hypothetical protein
MTEHAAELSTILRPAKHSKMFWSYDEKFLNDRAKVMRKYLQDVLDTKQLFAESKLLRPEPLCFETERTEQSSFC